MCVPYFPCFAGSQVTWRTIPPVLGVLHVMFANRLDGFCGGV